MSETSSGLRPERVRRSLKRLGLLFAFLTVLPASYCPMTAGVPPSDVDNTGGSSDGGGGYGY